MNEKEYRSHEESSNPADLITRYLAYYFRLENDDTNNVDDLHLSPKTIDLASAALTLEITRQYYAIPRFLDEEIIKSTKYVRRLAGRSGVHGTVSQIFLSYRRTTSSALVGRIRMELEHNFGIGSVFQDINNMPYGFPHNASVDSVISQCSAILWIVDTDINASTPGSAFCRLFNEFDPVRIELESALKHETPIVPVIVGDTVWPPIADLPESLQRITSIATASIPEDGGVEEHMSKLMDICREKDEARQNGLENLFVPEMSSDTRLYIRILAYACWRVGTLWALLFDKSPDVQRICDEINSGHIASCESIIAEWTAYFGLDSSNHEKSKDSDSEIESLFEFLKRLIQSCNEQITNENLSQFCEEHNFNEHLSLEQVIAMSGTAMINQQWLLVPRNHHLAKSRSSPTMASRAVDYVHEGLNYKNVGILLPESICDPYIRRIETAYINSFSNRCHYYRNDSADSNIGIMVVFISEHGVIDDEKHKYIVDACASDCAVVPVLLPGTQFPDLDGLPEALQLALRFTAMELRPDPLFTSDLEHLLQVCRQFCNPAEGFATICLPEHLRLDLLLPVQTLINALGLLRNNAQAYQMGHWPRGEISPSASDTIEIAKSVINIWKDYFDFEMTD